MKRVSGRAALLGETAILAYFGLADFLLHLAFIGRYGYFRDELFYIICGERLAFGYVDHPPFTPLVARLSRLVFGDSLRGLRILPALAGAAAVVLAGLIARKLGGGRFAQALTALAVLLLPIILAFGGILTNNAFDILFWTLAAYLLILILKEDRPRLWLAFGVVVGVSLQNKYSIAFFVAALGIGLLLSSARKRLASPWPWAGAAVALLIFFPNLIWQIRHGLPFIELNRNAVLYKNAQLSPLQFLGRLTFEAQPIFFLIVLAGLFFFLLAAALKPFRAFGWAFLALWAFFLFAGGKTSYLPPVYPVMLAAGAVALERLALKRRWNWVKPAAVLLLLMNGAVVAPGALPILSVEKFISYGRFLGLSLPAEERNSTGPLPQHFADQFGWEEMAETVARVYRGLPEADREVCGIYTQNYGEASAINFFGRKLGLPPAISGHNNYWVWGPGELSGAVMIVVGGSAEDHRKAFAEVSEVARTDCKYAMPYENHLPIYVCRGPKGSIKDIWPHVKHFI
jgi:hypothetical protein